MPKDPRIKKVLVIGSGPIIIGQAAEFDYSGTQACRALKAEGIETVLLNSNPATIMTDPDVADHVYIEPMTLEGVERILDIEKPDSVLPNLGGQMGLNLSMELARSGYLDRTGITQIRPLLYCGEGMLRNAAKRGRLPVVFNPCPADGNTKRQEIKDLLTTLSAQYPDVRSKVFGAMQRLPLDGWGPTPHERVKTREKKKEE